MKKRTSGRPSANTLPGTGVAYERAVKTSGCSVTMWCVGPRHTETASTSGTSRAMVTTHDSRSK